MQNAYIHCIFQTRVNQALPTPPFWQKAAARFANFSLLLPIFAYLFFQSLKRTDSSLNVVNSSPRKSWSFNSKNCFVKYIYFIFFKIGFINLQDFTNLLNDACFNRIWRQKLSERNLFTVPNHLEGRRIWILKVRQEVFKIWGGRGNLVYKFGVLVNFKTIRRMFLDHVTFRVLKNFC